MSKLFSFFSMSLIQLLVLLFTTVLAACDGGGASQSQATATTTIARQSTSPAQATTSPSPQATPSQAALQPELPFSQYSLSAVLDYDLHYLTVEEQITYVNHASTPLPDLLLLVEPNRYTGGFTLKQDARGGGSPGSGLTPSGPAFPP